MLKFIGFILNLFLIVVIFLCIPQENIGLSSLATKNEILGSRSSNILNIVIAIGILLYIYIALQLNFSL